MKKILFFLFFSFLTQNSICQTITGKIQAIGNVPIGLANVLIKDGENIAQFVIARNGQYTIIVSENYPKIVLEVTAQGHLAETKTIENPEKDKTYTLDFLLQINNDQNLEEVTIEAPKRVIEEKGDSTFYNVDAYKQAGDRKIIDVIKKMPNMSVNDKTGEIKYKGKSIETVTLDGDNLFGHNYSLGTKNISVDMVQQVQAIENYSANPLLKDLEGGDKVALNLKLKNGIDISGAASMGAGIAASNKGGVYDGGTHILGIAKRFKSFGIFSYNNIGINHSPFDYFGNSISVEGMKEKNYNAQKIIPEMIFGTALDDTKANINDAWFGNYNMVFKVNKRMNLKTNTYYLQDNIFSNQITTNQIKFGSEDFNTSDNRTIYKNPTYGRGDIEIKYNTSKTSLLEYSISLTKEQIKTQNNTLQNEITNFDTQLQSDNLYLKQKAIFTKRLKNIKALQIEINHATNNLPQNLRINPAVLNANAQFDEQQTQNQKNYFEIKNTLLGNYKGKKYTITGGFIWDNNKINSNLLNVNNTTQNSIAKNDLEFTKKNIYVQSAYYLDAGKWRFSPALRLEGLIQTLKNYEKNTFQEANNLIFLPTLNIRYKINELNAMTANASYSQSANVESYLFENSILVNNRSINQNIPNLSLQSSYNYGLRYRHADTFNQFFMGLGVNYQQREGNFFNNLELSPTITRTTYFFLPQNADNLAFDGMIDGYVPFLDAFIKLTANYNISRYKNIINNSELRDNQSNSVSSQLDIRTTFPTRINFQNQFNITQNISQNQNNRFTNAYYNNLFKIMISLSKSIYFVGKFDYYLPNTQKTQENYIFLDFSLSFKTENKKYRFELTGNNLMNNDTFFQVETSDFGITRFDSRLLPRYLMLSFGYDF